MKNFFKSTFHKIQNKLKTPLANLDNDDKSSNKTPNNRKKTEEDGNTSFKNTSLNKNDIKIQNLTSLYFHMYDSKDNTPQS